MIINFNPLPASACYGNQDQGVIIAAVGESMWNNRAACGRRYTIRCTGPTNQGIPQPCTGSGVTVSVVDRCAGCGANQFDLSQQAFSRIANTDAGRIRIDYARSQVIDLKELKISISLTITDLAAEKVDLFPNANKLEKKYGKAKRSEANIGNKAIQAFLRVSGAPRQIVLLKLLTITLLSKPEMITMGSASACSDFDVFLSDKLKATVRTSCHCSA
ncbi:hypothetical protein RJ639_016872 [Escallonia herrerae]|uniref:Expansin-like EG45 domain-containing protein n=1 Tax=Escallonia herrerae TaxID=1293975 RepID=A0AA89AL41_9ASTE|nr:hypothetical protein RJ639_016872 [Escallonia herrerae]